MAHPILQYQPNLAPLVASLEWELPELAPLFGGTVVSGSLTPGCGPPPQPPTKAGRVMLQGNRTVVNPMVNQPPSYHKWVVFESFPNCRLIIGFTILYVTPVADAMAL